MALNNFFIGDKNVQTIKLGNLDVKVYFGEQLCYPVCDETVIAKYSVTSTSSSTKLLDDTSNISAMEIDGVARPSVVSAYTFTTTGVHTVKYTLTDPTSISNNAFYYCTSLTSIDIPIGVTSIGDDAFYYCTSLTSIDIPIGVTSIGNYALQNCSSLTSVLIPNSVTSIGDRAFDSCSKLSLIRCKAMTAPTIQSSTFQAVKRGGILFVPQGSSGYNVWMQNANYYLGWYGWSKVEI